jgi:hypothetical protein
MRSLADRVNKIMQERILDLSSNTSYPILSCKFCGNPNKKGYRVDTEFDYLTTDKNSHIESFCIKCWLMYILSRI